MWEQYRKTFKQMQIVIALGAVMTFALTKHWQPALLMFGVMQVGALLGAAWAARLRSMMQKRNARLPLRSGI